MPIISVVVQVMVSELASRGGRLADGELTAQIDASAPVQLLLEDGRLTPVRVSDAARAAVDKLPRSMLSSINMSPEMRITLLICGLLAALACAFNCHMQAKALGKPAAKEPSRKASPYGKVSTLPDEEDDDDDDDDDVEEHSESNGARRKL